jgi:hypothetical protein
MHPSCQLEPEPVDFHESNENQAEEPFTSKSEVELDQNKIHKKFVPVSKTFRVFAINDTALMSFGHLKLVRVFMDLGLSDLCMMSRRDILLLIPFFLSLSIHRGIKSI